MILSPLVKLVCCYCLCNGINLIDVEGAVT